nr:MAG TPA: hypothetical protein [Caudoviricetes sp.]
MSVLKGEKWKKEQSAELLVMIMVFFNREKSLLY